MGAADTGLVLLFCPAFKRQEKTLVLNLNQLSPTADGGPFKAAFSPLLRSTAWSARFTQAGRHALNVLWGIHPVRSGIDSALA